MSKEQTPTQKRSIFDAIVDNNLDEFMQLVSRLANVNEPNKKGVTPLMLAAQKGNVGMVKALIENGADINAKNRFGQTALFPAISSGNIEVVNELKRQDGVNVNEFDNFGRTPLSYAVANENLALVKKLISIGADPNLSGTVSFKPTTEGQKGKTALEFARESGNVEIIGALSAPSQSQAAPTRAAAPAPRAATTTQARAAPAPQVQARAAPALSPAAGAAARTVAATGAPTQAQQAQAAPATAHTPQATATHEEAAEIIPLRVQEAKKTLNEVIALNEGIISYLKRYSEQEVLPNLKLTIGLQLPEILKETEDLKSISKQGSDHFEFILNDKPNIFTQTKNKTETADKRIRSDVENLVQVEINNELRKAIEQDNIIKFNQVLEYKASLYGKESRDGITHANAQETPSLLALAIEKGNVEIIRALSAPAQSQAAPTRAAAPAPRATRATQARAAPAPSRAAGAPTSTVSDQEVAMAVRTQPRTFAPATAQSRREIGNLSIVEEIGGLSKQIIDYLTPYKNQEVLPKIKSYIETELQEQLSDFVNFAVETQSQEANLTIFTQDAFKERLNNTKLSYRLKLESYKESLTDRVQVEINNELRNAIEQNDRIKFNEVLEYKAGLYGKESTLGISYADAKETHSLLALAIENGKEDMAKALIENGADINARLSNTATNRFPIEKPILALAIEKGNVELVNALLEKGANPNAPATQKNGLEGSTRLTPMLVLAIEKGNVEIVNALLEKGADVNAEVTTTNSRWGFATKDSMLRIAIEKDKVEIVNAVLAKRVSIIQPQEMGEAINRGNVEIVNALLQKKQNIGSLQSYTKQAIEKGNVEIVNALLAKNPEMNNSILKVASDKSPEIKNAIKTYIANNNGQGELFEEAVSYRDEKTVKFLFDNFSTSEFSISDSERIYGVVDKLEALKTNSTFSTEEQKTLGKLSRKAFTEVGSYTHFSSPGQASNVKQALDEVNRLGDNNLKNELRGILLNPELDYNESLVHASVAALRAGNKNIGNTINQKINRTVDQALDNELKGHSPEYIALKFKGQRVDFNKLITQCSAESANIIVQAAEKQKGMENSPPSKWKELLIEFSDFCRNRGKKVGVERMRESLTNPRPTTSFPPARPGQSGQQTVRF